MTAVTVMADQLVRRAGGRVVVDHVDLRMSGGIVTVLGPNGAGKSTLLRCLATVSAPDEGHLTLDGLDPRHESDRIEARRRLGYLPQEPGFHASATVADVIDYLAVLREHDDPARRRSLVVEALHAVGLLDRAADRVGDLSGGMRRRLGLAQALLGRPGLLVLDEPAAGLDPDERRRLRNIVTSRRRDTSIVIATHHVDDAVIGDRIVVLDEGRVVFDGRPDQLAEVARGRAWVQSSEPLGARASWMQADGSHRCLGDPPPDAVLVEPTVEDGYLLVASASVGSPA